MNLPIYDRRNCTERDSRKGLVIVFLWLVFVAIGLAACSAGAAPQNPAPQQGGLMLPPGIPGQWYAGDFVSLDEAAAKVPFLILLPDEAVVGAELVSVELNHPETVTGVALHYANDVVVDQQVSSITALPSTLRQMERMIEVNGIPAIGKDAGYTESQITGGKVPYPATISWYVDDVYRYIRNDSLSMEELLRIAESMKPYVPAQP